MAKTKIDRKINRVVRKINKDLREDLFGNRFWIQQVKKSRDEDGLQYYLYMMRDRLEPNRDAYIGWIWGGSMFLASDFYKPINDFIVKSDFWSKYFNDETRYNRKLDTYYK